MNIIVTGASRGIGFETAQIFSKNANNQVIAISRNLKGLQNLKTTWYNDIIKENIEVLPFDLVNDNYQDLEKQILGRMETVDILLNNAGTLINKPFEMLDDDDFDLVFDTNVKSIFKLTRMLLPYFSQNAHIVNISSMGGFQGSMKFPGLSLYSASKGALAILTECLATEFKDRKISVNCLALGSAQTEMLSEAFPGYKPPLTAAQIAEFIADFSLNGHRWFNGKILPVALTTP